MKKLILLNVFFLFMFVLGVKAQSASVDINPGAGYASVIGHDDDGQNSGFYETGLFVWATGDQGDYVELVNNGNGGNGYSSAYATFDLGAATAPYPGENFTVHYSWDVILNDYNWCGGYN